MLVLLTVCAIISNSPPPPPRVFIPVELKAIEVMRQLTEQYHEEEKRRREMAKLPGCPFDIGTYSNVECA